MSAHHLAQFNVSRLLAPLDTPPLADFVAALDPVNALADGAPGFVWRLQDDNGVATSIRAFDDERVILNLSLWESAEALADFAYRSGHRDVMRRRREWFATIDEATLVLWWVPVGHLPGVAEAKDRLELLRRVGPSPAAFTFRSLYPVGQADPISVAPPVGNVTLGRRPGLGRRLLPVEAAHRLNVEGVGEGVDQGNRPQAVAGGGEEGDVASE